MGIYVQRQSTYIHKAIQLIKHTSNINIQSIFDSKFYTIKNKPYLCIYTGQ